jgi:Primase C terminal 2 (PriCT-2)/AAA domain
VTPNGTATTDRPPAPPLPDVPLPRPDRLPAELRESRAWMLWRRGDAWKWNETEQDWKLAKVPCDRAGRAHDMTDPEIRGGLVEALTDAGQLRERHGPVYGVGLTFCAVQGFFCLDLDRDLIDRQPSDRLTWLYHTCPTWGEVSIRRRGGHLFYRGRADGKQTIRWRGDRLEIFGSKGFIAVTGESLDTSIIKLTDGDELLNLIRLEAARGERHGKAGSANGQAYADDKPSVDRVRAALKHVGDVDDHDRWIDVGMCLHDWDATDGYRLWLDWSRESGKYDKADCDRRWISFTPGGGLGIGTLFKFAKEGGWTDGPRATFGQNGTGKQNSHAKDSTSGKKAEDKPRSGWAWDLITSAAFAAAEYKTEFLVKRMIVAGEPLTIAGLMKTLKTSIAVDLAVSLGTRTPFLGHFDVYKQVRVAMLSGESGRPALQDVFRRVCRGRNIDPASVDVLWGFNLPSFADPGDMTELAEKAAEHGVGFSIADPAYLCALRGIDVNDAKSVFAMGAHLSRYSEAMIGAGVTPAIVHHSNRQLKPGQRMELTDLAYAGFAEHAAQWILGSRDTPYRGDGVHPLTLNCGGRQGQGGIWSVRIEEGVLADVDGRRWDVAVMPAAEHQEQQKEEKTSKREKDRDAAAEMRARDLHAKWLSEPFATATKSHMRGVMKWSGGDRINDAIALLVHRRLLLPTTMEVPAGKKTRTVDAYTARAKPSEVNPDNPDSPGSESGLSGFGVEPGQDRLSEREPVRVSGSTRQ